MKILDLDILVFRKIIYNKILNKYNEKLNQTPTSKTRVV